VKTIRRPGGRGGGGGRGDEEDTLTVHNNATKERIHRNTLGETEDRNAETRRKQRDALTPAVSTDVVYTGFLRDGWRAMPVLDASKTRMRDKLRDGARKSDTKRQLGIKIVSRARLVF